MDTIEGRKRALEVSQRIRELKHRDTKDDSYYLNHLLDAEKETKKVTLFFQEALNNPTLFITDTKHVLKNPDNHLSDLVGRYYKNYNLGFSKHDLQSLIGEKVNFVFQEWLKENKLQLNAQVETCTYHSYPSLYALYVEGEEIFRFNIYKKTFDIQFKHIKTVTEIKQRHKAEEKRLVGKLDENKKDLAKYQELEKNTWKFCRTLGDFKAMLFKREEVRDGIREIIKNTSESIDHYENKIEKHKDELPVQIERYEWVKQVEKELLPFFEHHNYSNESKTQ